MTVRKQILGQLHLLVLFLGLGFPCLGQAAIQAQVFPVKGFFLNMSEGSPIDPRMRATLKIDELGTKVESLLKAAFGRRVGTLSKNTLGKTFVASFHLTRAIQYSVAKPDGTFDLLTPVTGSVYFTNIRTGEVIMTVTETRIGRASISKEEQNDQFMAMQFQSTLVALLGSLTTSAAERFAPRMIETRVLGEVDELIFLDAGYKKGIQVGDTIEDASGNLIEVIYSSDDDSVAARKLAGVVAKGTLFHKFASSTGDGRERPRVAVILEGIHDARNGAYLTQLFSEQLGDKAPLSVVQVNPQFANLLNTVIQQASLDDSYITNRSTPKYLIRLRITDPIVFEKRTNVSYVSERGILASVFADFVDTSGRVMFSAIGKDQIKDEITGGFGVDVDARREVALKNALLDLAKNIGTQANMRRDMVTVKEVEGQDVYANGNEKHFPPRQKGYLLRDVRLGDATLKLPISEAFVDRREGDRTRLGLGAPLNSKESTVKPGDIFEVHQMGAAPKYDIAYTLCEGQEDLGAIDTPNLRNLAYLALGMGAPGLLYVTEIAPLADALISDASGFNARIKWNIPTTALCVLPVQRVNAEPDECDNGFCQRPVTARYAIRVVAKDGVVSRTILEIKFKSDAFYSNTDLNEAASMVSGNLVEHAERLFGKIAEKIKFTP
jgi:hypothetical protein